MPLLITVALVLALIPLNCVGEHNDFVMRVSIPALLAMRVLLGQITLALARLGDQKRLRVFVMVLTIGAVLPVVQIARSVRYWQNAGPDYNSVPPVHLCSRLSAYYIGDASRDTIFFSVFAKKPSLSDDGKHEN